MKKSQLASFIKEEIISLLEADIPSVEDVKDVTAAVKDLKDELASLEEDEDKEPSDVEIKKNKSLAKAAEELALLTREMKSLAKKYSKAEGEDKELILSKLKSKTKLKKELESIIDK